MIKQCPKCLSHFECKNDKIMACGCVTVVLSKEAYAYISKTYNDCLCTKCLHKINTKLKGEHLLKAQP